MFLARICHRFFQILFSDNETNSKSLWKNLNTKRSIQPIVLMSQDKYILVISCQPFVLCMGRKRDKGRKYINILFKNKMKLTDSLCGKVCVCECEIHQLFDQFSSCWALRLFPILVLCVCVCVCVCVCNKHPCIQILICLFLKWTYCYC